MIKYTKLWASSCWDLQIKEIKWVCEKHFDQYIFRELKEHGTAPRGRILTIGVYDLWLHERLCDTLCGEIYTNNYSFQVGNQEKSLSNSSTQVKHGEPVVYWSYLWKYKEGYYLWKLSWLKDSLLKVEAIMIVYSWECLPDLLAYP